MILWNLNPRWERTQKDQKGEERITATQRGIFLKPQYSHKHIQRSPTGFLELQNSVMRLFHTWTPRFPNWTPWRCSLRWHRDTSVHIKFVNAIFGYVTTKDNRWQFLTNHYEESYTGNPLRLSCTCRKKCEEGSTAEHSTNSSTSVKYGNRVILLDP